jgi:hypothetical protein
MEGLINPGGTAADFIQTLVTLDTNKSATRKTGYGAAIEALLTEDSTRSISLRHQISLSNSTARSRISFISWGAMVATEQKRPIQRCAGSRGGDGCQSIGLHTL